jgi:hypothetical protein
MVQMSQFPVPHGPGTGQLAGTAPENTAGKR